MNKVVRINNYQDNRFKKNILRRKLAYEINNDIAYFDIISNYEAIVYTNNKDYYKDLINKFRYHNENITKFYDSNNNIIKEFSKVNLFNVNINDLYVSQFCISRDKYKNLYNYFKKEEDILIPVYNYNDKIIILDGHTRLFIAKNKNFKKVYCYLTNDSFDIYFYNECQKRNINTIYDLELVSKSEYKNIWIKFCNNYFKKE